MFGFGKRKSEPQKPERARRSAEHKERKSQNLAQLGFLAGVSDDGDDLMAGMDVGDDDLEEELAMLLEGKQPVPRRPNTSPPKKPQQRGGGGRKSAGNPVNFDVDNEAMEEDDDLDEDLDDPDLEAELGDILGIASEPRAVAPMDEDDGSPEPPSAAPTITTEQLISLLEERLGLYEKAKAAADSVGDSAKSRRFTRGLKTLKEMIPKAKAGRVIDEADIPPAVSIGVIKKDSSPEDNSSSQAKPFPAVPPRPTSTTAPTPAVPPRPDRSLPTSPVFTTEPEEPVKSQPSSIQPAIDIDSNEINYKLPEPLMPTPAFVPAPVIPDQQPTHSDPTPPVSVPCDPIVEARLKDYKRAAVGLKRQGDVQGALKYLKLSKNLETAVKNGENIDINDYPSVEASQEADNMGVPAQPTSEPTQPPPQEIVAPSVAPDSEPTLNPPPSDDIFGAPPPPKSVMEALEQRLSKYKSEVEKATSASNSSKARRMGRIVKQYEEAIGLHKKGKPVPFDELPTPPGFAPIPTAASIPTVPVPQASQPQPGTGGGTSSQPHQSTTTAVIPSSPGKAPVSASPKPSTPGSSGVSPSGAGSISRSGKPSTKLTLQEKQLQIITLRQQQFKEAALNAKKRGDVNQAREFLRTAKGFDKLIQVAQAGLPVDMATLPSPPEAVAKLELDDADNFEVVSASDCIMPSGSAAEVFSKLEDDLKQQLKMCMRTREHFRSIGDVASANRFESMALESKRDLDALRLAMKKSTDLPKYHYETRIFSITECNTDVAEDEIEINIIQGINYKVTNPSDVDTFVKIELPYPTAEEVQTNKTQVVKDTNNPAYNATYKMNINRTARNFQRFVHRNGFKCEVWSKGGLCSGGFFFCQCHRGFLRGSTLIGTATVKLLPLETKCTLHDAFDILEGRKVVGKLEVKVRVREPVLTKQITQKKEKWLSIDRV